MKIVKEPMVDKINSMIKKLERRIKEATHTLPDREKSINKLKSSISELESHVYKETLNNENFKLKISEMNNKLKFMRDLIDIEDMVL